MEVLTLVTNTLQNDLHHMNQFVVGLALTALGNIASAEMARTLAPEVDRHLRNSNPYIRKKAALCAVRLIDRVPDLIEDFLPRVASILTDHNHAVLLSGVTLVQEIVRVDGQSGRFTKRFKALVPALIKILRKLVVAGFAPEFDVGGVTDPFLQARVLRLLRVLGEGDTEASEAMSDILAQVATKTDTSKNVGNAIMYECVQTIMAIEAEKGLRVLAINKLGRFLAHKDNNIRYVALATLLTVVRADKASVLRQKATIVACLRDSDTSIRIRAMELVYVLIDGSNVRELTQEILHFLATAHGDVRTDVCSKIGSIVERYATSPLWQVTTLIRMMHLAGDAAPAEAVALLPALISQNDGLHGFAVHRLSAVLEEGNSLSDTQLPLIDIAAWVVGEYADLLLTPHTGDGASDLDTMGLNGVKTQKEVVDVLGSTMRLHCATSRTRAIVLSALLKLTTRFTEDAQLARVRKLLGSYSSSLDVELQQRSVEFAALASDEYASLRPAVLEQMPVIEDVRGRVEGDDVVEEEMTSYELGSATKAAEAAAAGEAPAASAGEAAAPSGDLLDLDDLFGGGGSATPPIPTTGVAPGAGGPSSGIDDLFGGASTPAAPTGTAATTTPAGGAPAAPPATRPASASVGHDDIMGLFGAGPPAAPAAAFGGAPAATAASTAPPAPAAAAFPPIVAFEGGGLRVEFAFQKPDGPGTPRTVVNVTARNTGGAPISGFVFQSAVPKFLKQTIGRPSATDMPPGGSVALTIELVNSAQGRKAPAMRLKIDYSAGGAPVSQQCVVSNFPAGL